MNTTDWRDIPDRNMVTPQNDSTWPTLSESYADKTASYDAESWRANRDFYGSVTANASTFMRAQAAASVTGYPFDMNDDETEDEYVDRMIAANDGGPYDPYYASPAQRVPGSREQVAAETQDWNRTVTDRLAAVDDGWGSARVHVQRASGVMVTWSDYKGEGR
jgi:hypothetical protein